MGRSHYIVIALFVAVVLLAGAAVALRSIALPPLPDETKQVGGDADSAVIVYSKGNERTVIDPQKALLIRSAVEQLLATAQDQYLSEVMSDRIAKIRSGDTSDAVELVYRTPRTLASPEGKIQVRQILVDIGFGTSTIYLMPPEDKVFADGPWSNHDDAAVTELEKRLLPE